MNLQNKCLEANRSDLQKGGVVHKQLNEKLNCEVIVTGESVMCDHCDGVRSECDDEIGEWWEEGETSNRRLRVEAEMSKRSGK